MRRPSAVVIGFLCLAACGDRVVHVRGALIGTRTEPRSDDDLSPIEQPLHEEILELDSDPAVNPRTRVVEHESPSLDYLKSIDLRVRLASPGPPNEGYVFLAFVTDELIPQDVRIESQSGNIDWHLRHSGRILVASHYWYDASPQPTKRVASINGPAGAAYLVRRELDDPSRIRIPFVDPRVVAIPACALASPGAPGCPTAEAAAAPCFLDGARCLDVSRLASYLRLSMARDIAASVAAFPTANALAAAAGSSVTTWVNTTFGTTMPAPPAAGPPVPVVTLGGPAGDGAPRVYWVPHAVGANGSPGFTFVFQMTLLLLGGSEVTLRIPVSFLFELQNDQYAVCVDPFVGADPALCGTTELNSGRVLVAARTPLGVGAAAIAADLRTRIVASLTSPTPASLTGINLLRLLLRFDLQRYREEVTTAPIPAKADVILLPERVDGGEVSDLLDPGGTPVSLWLLE